MIREYNEEEDSGVSVQCDKKCVAVYGKDWEKRIQREQITNRRYTKAEIVASLEILGDYLSENDMQKRALFETFVDKVVAYKDGKIVVNVDVFGTKAKIESIDGVVNGVRTEKLVLRQEGG